MSESQLFWIGNFDRILHEDDLKPKPGISINPPPSDGRCDCCGRSIGELKPFGGPGDPLVGDFTGALLVKGYRSVGIYDEEAEKTYDEAERYYEAEGFDDPLDWMIDKYGQEKAMKIYYTVQAYGSVESSWECRDCMVLDMEEYFEKISQWSEKNT